jgi:hypothetical protein
MKIKILYLLFLVSGICFTNIVYAEKQMREVPPFSEISLRVSGKLYVRQGDVQGIEISAESSSLEEIITEVRGRTLNIRFKTRNLVISNFDPGNIVITITVPEINSLSVAGSGDIIADKPVNSRIIDLIVSGSGNIFMDELNSERVKATISGSGDIEIAGGTMAQELSVVIGGSGNVKAENYEAANVDIKIAGSGNCNVYSNGNLKARIAGSGSVYYSGNPSIDTSVLGSGVIEKR